MERLRCIVHITVNTAAVYEHLVNLARKEKERKGKGEEGKRGEEKRGPTLVEYRGLQGLQV